MVTRTKEATAQIAAYVRAIIKGIHTPDSLQRVRESLKADVNRIIADMEKCRIDDPDRTRLNGAALAIMAEQIAIMDAFNIAPLADAVLKHAEANYNKGWDVVIEATDWPELVEAIGKSKTAHGAISRVAKVLAIRTNKSYGDDIRGA